MNDDLFARDFNSPRQPPERDNLFIWTILILLLIGLALACWLGSFYVFGHPEKPDSYKILQKLHKLDPPKRFELTQAPPGDFLTPQKAFERFSSMSRFDLERENQALLRDYINNFQSTKRLVPYITGRYSIMNAYELKQTDFFGSGVVAIAQSVDFPQTVIEHVYTASPQSIPVLEQMLATGLDIKLEKTMDLSAIIQATRMPDGRIQFTVVPLLYGSYALKQGNGSFSLEPPAILNPGGGLPIVRGQLLDDALKSYTDYVRKRSTPRVAVGGGTPAIPQAQSAAQTTIVRVEVSPTPAPSASPIPGAVAIAPPVKTVESPTPTPSVAQAETVEQPVAQATPTPSAPLASATAPAATPREVATPAPSAFAVSSPAVTPPQVAAATPPKVPLVPFLVSSPTPVVAGNTGASWRTYSPGQMPRGRLVESGELGDLANRGTGGERLYLHGNFVVTASGENRAVLRPSGGALSHAIASVTKQTVTRIIVDFPAGMPPLPERTNVARDESRPFEIRDIRRGADGQINVYVREVTAP